MAAPLAMPASVLSCEMSSPHVGVGGCPGGGGGGGGVTACPPTGTGGAPSSTPTVEEQRALQIALELSMLGLQQAGQPDGQNHHGHHQDLIQVDNKFSDSPPGPAGLGGFPGGDDAHKLKKSANMTECVPVPSSEHVAEIVGRQGCKIKALRAKTNTYIKTPVRGEEPVFVVTGRREDVGAAKREILSAAEHFSQIRASRRQNGGSTSGGVAPGPPSPGTPGQVTAQVRVPYRVVGLVVGPKGATIKRIQQQTHTYIVTPSRDKEPVFEVTGSPENVEKARVEIESHIALRTGGMVDANNSRNLAPDDLSLADFHQNGVDSGFHELSNDLMGSIYKVSTPSAFTSYSSGGLHSSNNLLRNSQDNNIFTFPTLGTSSKLSDFTNITNGFTNTTTNGFGLYDSSDEGIASPTFDTSNVTPLASTPLWPDLGTAGSQLGMFSTGSSGMAPRRSSSIGSTTPRLSPTLTDNSTTSTSSEHTAVRRIRSDPLTGGLASMSAFAPLPQTSFATSSGSLSSSTSTSPTDSTGSLSRRRSCCVCTESDIVAALVPCGHNLFCMECANLIVEKPESERRCPVCTQTPSQAIRILS